MTETSKPTDGSPDDRVEALRQAITELILERGVEGAAEIVAEELEALRMAAS